MNQPASTPNNRADRTARMLNALLCKGPDINNLKYEDRADPAANHAIKSKEALATAFSHAILGQAVGAESLPAGSRQEVSRARRIAEQLDMLAEHSPVTALDTAGKIAEHHTRKGSGLDRQVGMRLSAYVDRVMPAAAGTCAGIAAAGTCAGILEKVALGAPVGSHVQEIACKRYPDTIRGVADMNPGFAARRCMNTVGECVQAIGDRPANVSAFLPVLTNSFLAVLPAYLRAFPGDVPADLAEMQTRVSSIYQSGRLGTSLERKGSRETFSRLMSATIAPANENATPSIADSRPLRQVAPPTSQLFHA
jgi:hypothetical protein